MQRIVHTAEAVGWLEGQARFDDTHALVTSLPDSSEVPALGFAGWRSWFIDTVALVCDRTGDGAVSVFFQTDVKRDGTWVDKGYLVSRGAEAAGVACLWHKVVCRAPPGITTFGRPAYAHLMAFSRGLRLEPGTSSPDVIPRLGAMPWARAMGVEACTRVATFLLDHTPCRTVVDPFCGMGTMLAVANAHGLSAIGVELSPRRAERARSLQIPR